MKRLALILKMNRSGANRLPTIKSMMLSDQTMWNDVSRARLYHSKYKHFLCEVADNVWPRAFEETGIFTPSPSDFFMSGRK